MSLTLGEKLRQAREERGFTLGDVAEQTRISSLYLESIENDDYKILPGGIFNKGFVKSYAKFVGINEAEALADYTSLIAGPSGSEPDDSLKVYRPEVLTDDRTRSSMIPTVILAAVILGLLTAAALFLVSLRQTEDTPAANALTPTQTTNADDPTPAPSPDQAGLPSMESIKIEFKAISEPVSLLATSDGKTNNSIVAPGTTASFEPKQSLKLSYSRSLANFVQLTINGKQITLPAQPLVARRNAIEFEINRENLSQIWTSGAISAEVPAASPQPAANTALPANTSAAPTQTPATTEVPTPVKSPTARPTVANTAANTATNSAPRPTPDRRPAKTPTPRPPVANNQP